MAPNQTSALEDAFVKVSFEDAYSSLKETDTESEVYKKWGRVEDMLYGDGLDGCRAEKWDGVSR